MRCPRLVTAALVGLLTTTSFGETSSSEETLDRSSFETVARDYRIYIYETYRTQRDEYDRRAAEAKLVSTFWHKLEDAEQQQALYDWFVDAKAREDMPELPNFMLDESLVIKKEVTTPALVDTTPAAPQPSFGQFSASNATPGGAESTVSQRNAKPGFFTALTKALVSKPNDESPRTTKPNDAQPEKFDDFAFAESDQDPASEEANTSDVEVAAEVFDETPFAAADELALADDIAQFNADRDAVYAQLEDVASLNLDAFANAVEEIEALSAREALIVESTAAIPNERQHELPELLELDSVIFLAAERAHETEWINDPNFDPDQMDGFSRRLANLIIASND